MIDKLHTEIENFINSDNDWMRKTYEVDEANTYTPCYMLCGNIPLNLNRRTKPFCFIFVGGF